jgi:Arc/MetJ-type ribon-helix-helix transcriptional regulator
MNRNLPPEQERIVNEELRSGNSRSAEEVIAKALETLREREHSSIAPGGNGCYEGLSRTL